MHDVLFLILLIIHMHNHVFKSILFVKSITNISSFNASIAHAMELFDVEPVFVCNDYIVCTLRLGVFHARFISMSQLRSSDSESFATLVH